MARERDPQADEIYELRTALRAWMDATFLDAEGQPCTAQEYWPEGYEQAMRALNG